MQCPEQAAKACGKGRAPLVVIVEEAESIDAAALAGLIKYLDEVYLQPQDLHP